MQVFTPLPDGLKVKPYIVEHGLKSVALVFLHGLGDTIMFRSVFDVLKHEVPDTTFTLYVHASQESLVPGARPWQGFEDLDEDEFEVVFVLEFPIQQVGYTKAHMCAEYELGLTENHFELLPLRFPTRSLVAVHFHGTCNPHLVNPDEAVMRRIHDIISEEDGIPMEVHFEHCYHHPDNKRGDWFLTHVRGHMPTPQKLYSLIAGASCFVGVLSGPLMMALAIDPARVIYLKKCGHLRDFTALRVPTIDVTNFDETQFRTFLREKIAAGV